MPKPSKTRALSETAVAIAATFALVAPPSPARAQSIYTCVNAKGNHIRADRPIAECTDREQRVLNRDGSLNRVIPPTLSIEERAAKEAQERRLAAERDLRKEAERADRNLLQRYPNESAHAKARDVALERARVAITQSQARLKALEAERKPLADEAEFYIGRTLPLKLKARIDANDAATEAQQALIVNQQAEVSRISMRYEVELIRLRKLWSGVVPGSLGPLVMPGHVSAPTAP